MTKEPTNYLDQPSLAALAAGLKALRGAVVPHLIVRDNRENGINTLHDTWLWEDPVVPRLDVIICG